MEIGVRQLNFILSAITIALVIYFAWPKTEVTSNEPVESTFVQPKTEAQTPPNPQKPTETTPDSEVRRAFRQFTNDLYSSLPTNEQVAAEEEGNHELAPKAIFPIADKMGEIRQQLRQNPEIAPDVLEFYDSCARKEGALDSTRATCLRNYIDLRAHLQQPIDIDGTSYSDDIKRIAKELSSIPF